MNREMILTADVLDIIFDGRNKTYGAYNLRKTYNQRIRYALAGTAAVCMLLYLSSIYNFGVKKDIPQMMVGPEISISEHLPEETKPLPPPPPPKPQPRQVETRIFVTPHVVPDQQVVDPPPTVETLNNTTIGTQNIAGIKGDGTIEPPAVVNSNGTGVVTAPKVKDVDNGGFIVVQIEAEFPGGKDAWKRYLERNLDNQVPANAGAPAGKYTVIVSFMVDEHGNLSNVVAENDPDYGTAAEAVRVIKKGPAWKPAIQNGRPVAYRVRQSITFVVDREG